MATSARQRSAHSSLEKRTGKQCFLDSDNLRDLKRLRDHVRESKCVVLLQTRSVLTRLWCIVELVTAIDANVPIIGVVITSGAHPYDFAAASSLMTHLDTLLDVRNAGAETPSGGFWCILNWFLIKK